MTEPTDFSHFTFKPKAPDTIFALATGQGKSAIAIVRVSGPQCKIILRSLCRREVFMPRQATFTNIVDAAGSIIDRAIVIHFPAPHSFTGEDMAEFQVTGGAGVKAALLRALQKCENTREAAPGEFARRAFEKGKLDLIQVEGLAAIVAAESEAESRQSALMAFGDVSRECERAREALLNAAAVVAGFLDFSDVEDPDIASITAVQADLKTAHEILKTLRSRSRVIERLRHGYTVALVGKPNAGKSTLTNYLLQRDAAIVSPFPGTTRDYLEFFVEMDGIPIVFIDTAGFRETSDPVETLGVNKSRARIRGVDLVLWLSETEHEPDLFIPKEALVVRVRSKCDLGISDALIHKDLRISTHTGQGMEQLIATVLLHAREYFADAGSPALGTDRQTNAVDEALSYLTSALGDIQKPEEFLAEEIRGALTAIGRVTGRVDVENVLDEVFSRLCVGK